MLKPDGRKQFIACLPGIDADQLARLEAYHDLLLKWTSKINLVGRGTLNDIWTRHFLDSAQLTLRMQPGEPFCDIGTGAGFPGLVLAAVGYGPATLIESDARKAAFLREAARTMGLTINLITGRIEAVEPQNAQVVTARALAPLPRLLSWAHRHLAPGGRAILLKGKDVSLELTESQKSWNMNIHQDSSLTDPAAAILTITNMAQKNVR